MWFDSFAKRRYPAQVRRRSPARRPRLEALEHRWLLSGAGSLDPTFGSGGIVTAPLGSGNHAYAVAIQPSDGMIVAAGDGSNGSGNGSFAVTRYTTAGALDTTFGNGGNGLPPAGPVSGGPSTGGGCRWAA